jgi:hypothetical protein
LFLCQPLEQSALTFAERINVPGGDFHRR